MYWFSYDNREIPYKIDTMRNPYINHPRASEALHMRVATCHTHIGVPHVCHMRAHHAPRLAPTVLLLDSSIGLSPLCPGFQNIKILFFFQFSAPLGVVASRAHACLTYNTKIHFYTQCCFLSSRQYIFS